jgi:UDP-2,3-diacylglucosamine pyrophosphatase LpxH
MPTTSNTTDAQKKSLPATAISGMFKDELRYIVVSDIHLGHPRTTTEFILKNLTLFFNNFAPRNDIDIIFFAGDVFDRLLDFSSNPDIAVIVTWVARFHQYCSANNIKFRVLEGTPSHDWKQSEIFATMHEIGTRHDIVDMKYISTLCIERIEDLGITVLYVPDEWNASTDETFRQVQQLLQEAGLTQVDIAIMHGAFDYQIPAAAVKAPRHRESDYLSIVRFCIHPGHIHTHTVFERIIAQGSFDRLAHNEEEPKGGLEVVIRRDGSYNFFFIENTKARLHKTLTIKQTDIDSILQYIAKRVANYPHDSYVRIKANKDNPVIIGFQEVRKKFPFLNLTKKTLEEEALEKQYSERNEYVVDKNDLYVPITITKENIDGLLTTAITTRYPDVTQEQLRMVSELLKEIGV